MADAGLAHVAARQSTGGWYRTDHLLMTDLVRLTGYLASGFGESPGQGLYESPLTESNRRPSPYHGESATPSARNYTG